MIQFLKRRRHLSKIGQLGIVLFIVALAMSFIDTIWAIYLFKYFNNESLVGLVSSFFTIISFLSYLLIIPVIEKYDNKKLYLIGILGMALAYFAFAFTENIWIIILVGCLLSIFTVLRIDTYGILIKDNSKKAELSANEGLIYTIMNVAWTIGPIIAGFISGKFGIPIIFTLAGIFNIIAIGFFILIKIKVHKPRKKISYNVLKDVKKYFKDRDLLKNYIISGSSSIWWGLTFIYVPIYIIEKGLGVQVVAYFLFAIVLPLVLLEYYFSKKANVWGFNKLFFIGNIIPAIVLVSCFFIGNIYLLLATMVLGTIGMAMVEPTTEAHFFLISPKRKSQEYYSIYNTTLDVFSFIGKIFIAGLLLFFSLKISFLFVAAIFVIFALISLRMKEVTLLNE